MEGAGGVMKSATNLTNFFFEGGIVKTSPLCNGNQITFLPLSHRNLKFLGKVNDLFL